jgi:serine protease inhibitor
MAVPMTKTRQSSKLRRAAAATMLALLGGCTSRPDLFPLRNSMDGSAKIATGADGPNTLDAMPAASDSGDASNAMGPPTDSEDASFAMGPPTVSADASDAMSPPTVSADASDAMGTPTDSAGVSDAMVDINDGPPVEAGPTVRIDRVTAARTPASQLSPAALGAAVAANNAFALDLYARVEGDAGAATGNVLTSPLSASLALTMTYAGAAGQTAAEMATALHIDQNAGVSIFDGDNALSQALAARGPAALMNAQRTARGSGQPSPAASNFELQVVNSIWGEETYAWAVPFLTTLATSYDTGVYLEDFLNNPEQGRQQINEWVSFQTNDTVNNLLLPGWIDKTTALVLVNALHLKFPWDRVFNPSATTRGTFTRADGTTVSPDVMSLVATLAFVDDGQAQIVWLPLWNFEVSVVIALPHRGTDLRTYEASLTKSSAAFAQPYSIASVSLSIPKVTFTSPSFYLTRALQAMGMRQAFTPNADFSGMCTRPLWLVDVVQKATLSMQESGVEAAATTAVLAIPGNASPPAQMVVDRPFLVAILDVPTGAILFLGHIEDPTDPGSP